MFVCDWLQTPNAMPSIEKQYYFIFPLLSTVLTGLSMMDELPIYKKRFWLLRNQAIQCEISSLDAERDCERIVHLLSCYEFPFDITRSLELALFHTYASVSISSLLERTREFHQHGQKRYDDTRLLISHILEEGFSSGLGQQALERMNTIHGKNRIANDDYLFVLSTFISYPIEWVGKYGYRPFTPHEQMAWFQFFANVGKRMGITGIPSTWCAFQEWVRQYEATHMVYAASNRSIAEATIAVFAGWFPTPLQNLVHPVIRALITDELRSAFGFTKPSLIFCTGVNGLMKLRKLSMKVINVERHPKLIANTKNRTYPGNSYSIDGISPSHMKKR